MSINSNTYISGDVSAEKLVEAIAIVLGSPREKKNFSRGKGWYTAIARDLVHTQPNRDIPENVHVSIRATHNMQYYEITIAPTTFDRVLHWGSLFLYPSKKHPNHILLYGGVSSFWEELGKVLVDTFGGYMDFNDCDSVDIDYSAEKPRPSNCPDGDDEWYDFQQALLDIQPIAEFV